MHTYLIQGLLLGLTMGTTCLVTCGPIYGPFLMQRQRGTQRILLALMELCAGRFVAYAIFGAFVGLIGTKATLLHRPIFTFIAYSLAAAFLVASALASNQFEKGCISRRWARYITRPFILGAITGINLCPSFLVATTKAVLLGGIWAGMLFFMFFFVGTSFYMLPLCVFGILAGNRILRIVSRVASITVAIWLATSAVLILKRF